MTTAMCAITIGCSAVVFFAGCITVQKQWELAQSQDTVQAYEHFLQLHPVGEFAGEAQDRILEHQWNALEQEWNAAQSYDTSKAYFEFYQTLRHHPVFSAIPQYAPKYDILIAKAGRRITELYWKQAKSRDTLFAYCYFLIVSRGWSDQCDTQAKTRIAEIHMEGIRKDILPGHSQRIEQLWAEDATKAALTAYDFGNMGGGEAAPVVPYLSPLLLNDAALGWFQVEHRSDGLNLRTKLRDTSLQHEAIEALVKIGAPSIDELIGLLQYDSYYSPDIILLAAAEVDVTAAKALIRIGGSRATQAVEDHFVGKLASIDANLDWRKADAAVNVLERLGGTRARKAVVAHLVKKMASIDPHSPFFRETRNELVHLTKMTFTTQEEWTSWWNEESRKASDTQ